MAAWSGSRELPGHWSARRSAAASTGRRTDWPATARWRSGRHSSRSWRSPTLRAAGADGPAGAGRIGSVMVAAHPATGGWAAPRLVGAGASRGTPRGPGWTARGT